MRILALLLPVLLVAACHHHDRERPAEPASAPPAASNGAVSARIVAIDRRDDHLAVRLRLENLGETPVELKNLGDTLTGFRAQIEGRSFSADAYRRDDVPVTASRIAELPPLTPLELDLRWSIRPDVGTDNYDCAIVVGNLFQGGKRLSDITIEIPGEVVSEPVPKHEKEKKPKPADAKAEDKVAL